jgi:hypothetical protein
VLPEGSMGRIASDLTPDGEFPFIEYVWRVLIKRKTLAIDCNWSPKYRSEPGNYGLSWDGCISDGALLW